MKNFIRKYAKEHRKSLNGKELSHLIHQNLFKLQEFKSAENIFCYYSIGNEVNTTELFVLDKNWYIPKIKEKELLVCPYCSKNLEINKYKIPEPTTNPVNKDCLDIVILPALAADKSGYRIGYGGGYYDRFLTQLNKNVIKVVFLYSDLFYNSLPHDNWDIRSDFIITDKEVYKINC